MQLKIKNIISSTRSITTVKGLGIDIAPIYRIAKLVDQCDRATLNLLFTHSEIERCQSARYSQQAYAVCFASKEAVGKALGTGLADIDWNEIEASFTDGDRLTIRLYGKANLQAKRLEIENWFATWCHWHQHVLVHIFAQ